MILYHNPRCSKSRQTLALLEQHGHQPQIVRYLDSPLDESTLRAIAQQLSGGISSMVRNQESEYKAYAFTSNPPSEDELIAALLAQPKILQRPILVTDKGAAIGRPPEDVLNII